MFNLLGNIELLDLVSLYSAFLQQRQEKRDTKDITNKDILNAMAIMLENIMQEIKKGQAESMKPIQVVISHLHDTLEEAHEYYRDYVVFKESYPKVASMAIEMAQTHLNLYNKWHEVVVYLINEHKNKGNEIPPTMKALYDYEHKKLVEEYDELSYKIKNKL